MSIQVIYDNSEYSAEIEYSFFSLLSILGLEYRACALQDMCPLVTPLCSEEVTIFYGHTLPVDFDRNIIHIRPSDFWGDNYLQPSSLPSLPLPKTQQGVPLIYQGRHDLVEPFVRVSTTEIDTNLDILASTFFLLTRYEELLSDARDEHGRFPAEASLAVRAAFLDRPLVNEYADLLWSWIDHFGSGICRKNPWGEFDFAFCVTHDIDFLRKNRFSRDLHNVVNALLRGHPRYASTLFLALAKWVLSTARDPYDTFDYLLRTSQLLSFNPTFFFLVHEENGGCAGDAGYTSDDRRLGTALKAVQEVGCEIALHTSYDAFMDASAILTQRNDLSKAMQSLPGSHCFSPVGCRQHVLRWKTPESWRVRDSLGFLYDSSLVFAGQPGFRCGICLPFRPFDILERRTLDIYEVPPTVMDVTLSSPNYLDLPPAEGYDVILRLVDKVRLHNGVFVLLWHNSHLDPQESPGWRKAFEDSVSATIRQGPLCPTLADVVRLWTQYTKKTNRCLHGCHCGE